MNEPVELIVAVFSKEGQATVALHSLQKLAQEKTLQLFDAATLLKTADGHMHIQETQDVSTGRGALFGAIAGALFGLVGGPGGAIVGAAAGAAAGGAAAKKLDMGFADDFLKGCNNALKPGHSALLALVEQRWAERTAGELSTLGGHVLRNAVQKGLADQIASL